MYICWIKRIYSACEEIRKLVKLINSHNPPYDKYKNLFMSMVLCSAPKGKELEFKPQWWAVETVKKKELKMF